MRRWTIASIRAANRAAGGHWFDRQTMKHFGSRVLGYVYQGAGGVFFVSSERNRFTLTEDVRYSVRVFTPCGAGVTTVGPFMRYECLADARAEARRLARTVRESTGTKKSEIGT